jgi:hypothetical protein
MVNETKAEIDLVSWNLYYENADFSGEIGNRKCPQISIIKSIL